MTDDKTPGEEGFSWGLRPRAAEPPVAEPVEVERPSTSSGSEGSDPADIPTQAMPLPSGADIPTQAMPLPSGADIPTQAMEQQSPAVAEPVEAAFPSTSSGNEGNEAPTSAIDSLFAETKFQEYEDAGVLPALIPPIATAVQGGAGRPPGEHAPLSRRQKILLWTGIGVVAVLALVALFLMGMRIGAASTSSAAASHSTKAAASTAPKPAAASTGSATAPVAPGKYAWTALNGGECIQPFSSPWAAKFTVVDCAKDHHAQLILKGTLPDATAAKYPSATKLQAEITPLCTAPAALNYATAGAVTDAQIESSYPANEKDWKSGNRTFFCFVTRSSGDALPGNLAVPAAG